MKSILQKSLLTSQNLFRSSLSMTLGLFLLGSFLTMAVENKAETVDGNWTFTTVGKQAKVQKPEAFNKTYSLKFDGKKVDGKPFGWEIASSSLSSASKGGNISFTTHHTVTGQDYPIRWSGKLSSDGTEITDGKFSCMIASGTFTAKKS